LGNADLQRTTLLLQRSRRLDESAVRRRICRIRHRRLGFHDSSSLVESLRLVVRQLPIFTPHSLRVTFARRIDRCDGVRNEDHRPRSATRRERLAIQRTLLRFVQCYRSDFHVRLPSLFSTARNKADSTFDNSLTIFLSVIIDNLHRRSATALLTTEQRQWLDLRRLISRQRPSKRPPRRPSSSWRSWCFDRAANKHGWWTRTLTGLYIFNIVVLMTEATTTVAADRARDWIYLALTILYAIDIVVRITGFGWIVFTQNHWNIYDVVVVSGTLATTIPLLLGTQNQVALQLQKLFLVSIVFKLVQRSDSLNQLQKTAV